MPLRRKRIVGELRRQIAIGCERLVATPLEFVQAIGPIELQLCCEGGLGGGLQCAIGSLERRLGLSQLQRGASGPVSGFDSRLVGFRELRESGYGRFIIACEVRALAGRELCRRQVLRLGKSFLECRIEHGGVGVLLLVVNTACLAKQA